MADILEAEPIANYHCQTGENPFWDDVRFAVLWTDIPTGRLFEYDVLTGRHRQIYSGEPVGGFTVEEDGSLLLFQANQITRRLPDGTLQPMAEHIDADMRRFNDVIADPQGRVYAGTIGWDEQRGGLYRIGLDASATCLFKGTGCANGMGFSPDRRHFYWTCSTTSRIFRFRYDEITGELYDREVFVEVPKEQGVPDGLTVDAAGCIWSARWGGGAIYRYAPSGEMLEKIELPVRNVTSLAFGGPYLDELYITTAGGREGAMGLEGALFRVKAGAFGRLEYRSKIWPV